MQTITLEEAQANLPTLFEKTAEGESFIVQQNGRTLGKIIPALSASDIEFLLADRAPTQAEFDAYNAAVTPEQHAASIAELRAAGKLGGLEHIDFSIPADFNRFMEDEIADMFEGKQE